MLERKKAIFKGAGTYAIGTLGTKLLSFLIVPLYTYYISTSDMGVYDLLVTAVHLLSPIVTMQISDAAYKYIIRKDLEITLCIRSTLQVLFTNGFIALLLVLLFDSLFPIPYVHYFAIILVLNRILETLQKLLRALNKQMLFSISGIIYTCVFLSFNICQICFWGNGIKGLFISTIISCLISITFIFIKEPRLRVNIFRKYDIYIIKKLYRFSIPLVPNYLNWWVINFSDRFIVSFFLDISSNGILAIAHKFPSALQLVLNLFLSSWQDVIISTDKKDDDLTNSSIFELFYHLTFSSMWILIPLTKIAIIFTMNESYKEACDYVAFYYLGSLFQAYSAFYGTGYLRKNKTKGAFVSSVIAALINAIINLALIKFIGIQAAALSTFVAFLIMWLIREKQNRTELEIIISKTRFCFLCFSVVMVSTFSICFNYIVNIILLSIGTLFFVIINKKYLVGVYKAIIKYLKKIKKN